MFNFINRKLTKNYSEVPIVWVDFNLNYYNKYGEEGSCIARIHPYLKDDEFVINSLKALIQHVRDNYNMEDLSK